MQRYGRQSEYSRRAYEWMDESRPNLAGWKAAALLYSTLHGANHWFAAQTGKVPENRAGRNRRAGREPPRIFDDYRNLYGLSMHARCRGGFRTSDSRRAHALALLGRLEQVLPRP